MARTKHTQNNQPQYVTIDPLSKLVKIGQPFAPDGRQHYYVKVSTRTSESEQWRHLKRSTGIRVDARNALELANVERLRMLSEYQQENDPRAPLRLDAFSANYLKEAEGRGLSASYIRQIRAAFSQFSSHVGASTMITSIRPAQVRAFFLAQTKASVALAHYRCLHAAFKQAVTDDIMDANPFDKFDAKTIRNQLRPRPRGVLTPDQIMKIHAHLPKVNYTDRMVASLVLFLFGTALRRSEACYLKLDAVDEEKGVVRVRPTKEYALKTRASEADIPLTKPALEGLKDQRANRARHKRTEVQNSEWLFCNASGERYRPDSITKAYHRRIIKACKYLGIPTEGLDLHSLRHSMAQTLVDNEAERPVVSKLLRHGSLATTLSTYHKNVDVNTKYESVHRLADAMPSPVRSRFIYSTRMIVTDAETNETVQYTSFLPLPEYNVAGGGFELPL